MKKIFLLMICFFLVLLGLHDINAQEERVKQKETVYFSDEDAPIVFKFEPDFLAKNEKQKTEIAVRRKMIDTLQISDRKRLKLLKDLYKNGMSKRLKKALLTDTKFDDVEK